MGVKGIKRVLYSWALLLPCIQFTASNAEEEQQAGTQLLQTYPDGISRYLPAGREFLRETLSIGHDRQGWRFIGNGACHPSNGSPWRAQLREGCSLLHWNGNQSGPLVLAQGAFWQMSDLTLLGWHQESDRPSPGCDVGIHVRQRGKFNGSKASIDRVSLAGFKSAILVGHPGTSGNDTLDLNKCWISVCNSAIEIASSQAMGTCAVGCNFRQCLQVILASGGGDVTLRDCETDSRVCLLRITALPKTLSHNNGKFVIQSLKVDGHGGTLWLVDEQSDCNIRVVMEDLRLSRNQQAVRARLQSSARLDLRDVENLPADTQFEIHGSAKVILQDSELLQRAGQLIAPASTGGQIVLLNCWRSGKLIRYETASGGD